MLGPFERAPRRSSVRRRQIEEWPGRVRDGGDNPGALLVRSRIDQAVGRGTGKGLLQLVAVEFEQLRNALRLSWSRDLKQAFEQRPAGLAEEVVRSAFVSSRRVRDQRPCECRRGGPVVTRAPLKTPGPGRPALIARSPA